MEKSVFQILNEYDITEHLKKKDRIIYLPWSKAWMIVKSLFPSAKFTINKAADGCILPLRTERRLGRGIYHHQRPD